MSKIAKILVVPLLLLWSIALTAGCREAFMFAGTGICFQIIVTGYVLKHLPFVMLFNNSAPTSFPKKL